MESVHHAADQVDGKLHAVHHTAHTWVVIQTAPKLGNNTVEVRFSGTEAGICCSKPMGELLYLMRYWVVSVNPAPRGALIRACLSASWSAASLSPCVPVIVTACVPWPPTSL